MVPFLLALLTGILVWFITSKIIEFRGLREQFLERQREVYFHLLEPQIKILTAIQEGEKKKKDKELENIIKELRSVESRKRQFELNLIGNDETGPG